jgi:hypothetical protein
MDEEICDGVKILCERMENNPDDFEDGTFNPNTFDRSLGKFYYEGRSIEGLAKNNPDAQEAFWHLNQAEKDALVESYKKMMRNAFTRRIVERLLDTPEPVSKPMAQAPRAGKSILTTAAMQGTALNILNEAFDKEYDHSAQVVRYRAKDRYAVGTEAEIRKWATE